MNDNYDLLLQDISKISKIAMVPTMLEVICKSTGMGFAAIARVTESKWIACSVRDEIFFGLKAGGELEIKSTICNEIRDSRKAVIIENVLESDEFINHHTPKQYGFKSYISVPIILKNGDFFGTLCAIDPNPAKLNNIQTIGMFNLFAELISFHIQNLDLLQRSLSIVTDLNGRLEETTDENLQYQFIFNHHLQEPLRKLRLYSDSLLQVSEHGNIEKTQSLASKINSSAEKFSLMLRDVSAYSELKSEDGWAELLDLNRAIQDVRVQLNEFANFRNATITVDELPMIVGNEQQIKILFRQLINNAVRFTSSDIAPVVNISSTTFATDELPDVPLLPYSEYVRITIQNNSLSIHASELEKVFNMLYRQAYQHPGDAIEFGLAHCRKIVRLHRGTIKAEVHPDNGTLFIVTLPLGKSKI